ncbi:MAG: hypothetical protein FJW32_24145 [Acidobacteria bacterium]|nr:hypothetical protein [Acidobacteriota bacterium]
MADEWKDLWQGQPPEGARIVADVLRNRAAEAARKRTIERIGHTVRIVILTMIAIGGIFAVDRPLQRILFGITALWNLSGLIGVWHGLRLAGEAELESCVAFCRAELQRRRRSLGSAWLLQAGPVLLFIAALAYPAIERQGLVVRMLPLFSIVALWLVILAVQRHALLRAVDREIEELKNLEKAAGV